MNHVRYREMVTKFLWPKLNNIHLEYIWFKHGGATPHFANETIAVLRQNFPGIIIARKGYNVI